MESESEQWLRPFQSDEESVHSEAETEAEEMQEEVADHES